MCKGRISNQVRAYIKYHKKDFVKHRKNNSELVQRLSSECKIDPRSVYRLLKEPLSQRPKVASGGLPRKVDSRTRSRLVRNIPKIRKWNANWVCQDLLELTDIKNISQRTGQRLLNEVGYKYSTPRRKGVLQRGDAAKRLRFAKEWVTEDEDFWKEGIAFYFDGAGFIHKTNPYQDALACRGKIWRTKSEGLSQHCTSKGKKEGNGGRQAKFFVAISYDQGVILAHQYDKLNGESFAQFIRENFSKLFQKCGKSSKTWLQDGDPSQNSAKSRAAQEEVGADLLPIPLRSPEFNPIENVFAFVKKELRLNAIKEMIQEETFEEFSARVKKTLYSSDKGRINNIIASYGRRLHQVIVRKGEKLITNVCQCSFTVYFMNNKKDNLFLYKQRIFCRVTTGNHRVTIRVTKKQCIILIK